MIAVPLWIPPVKLPTEVPVLRRSTVAHFSASAMARCVHAALTFKIKEQQLRLKLIK